MGKKPQYKVIVSDRARQMLAGHVWFLAQKSPTAARRTKNEFDGRYPLPLHYVGAFSFSQC